MQTLTCLLVLFVLNVRCQYLDNDPSTRVKPTDWSYEPERTRLTPEKWYLHYPKCGGRQQSPIEIKKQSIVADSSLEPIYFVNIDKVLSGVTIVNNGTKLVFNVPADNDVRLVSNKFHSGYLLQEFYFHHPGEHLFNGQSFMGELNLVFKPMVSSASKRRIFVNVLVDDSDNKKKSKTCTDITDGVSILSYDLNKVSLPDELTELTGSLLLKQLLPEDTSNYLRYAGSVTFPPCTQDVDWYILANTVCVQEKLFRNLWSGVMRFVPRTNDENGEYRLEAVTNNNRPIQSINGRQIGLHGTLVDLVRYL